MLRKTLTILSLIGLLLSVVAWVTSYFDVRVRTAVPSNGCTYGLVMGTVYFHKDYYASYHRPIFHSGGNRGFHICWLPSYVDFGESCTYLFPLWIPTATFAVAASVMTYWPRYHRRKRKKLGLCLKCGYDLRGSKDRCPECGVGFSN